MKVQVWSFQVTKGCLFAEADHMQPNNLNTPNTLYNVILRIARNFLETRENIKISTHPFCHINLDISSKTDKKHKKMHF